MKNKILVVDDNTVNLATLEKGLAGVYETVAMISGKRALKYLYCQVPDLILLDVEMPEMNGVETLTEIRNLESCKKVPVIFLTAKKDKTTVLDGYRLGIMDYITKPFDIEDVKSRIDLVLKRAGKIPFELKELKNVVDHMIKFAEAQDYRQLVSKVVEATGYQIDEDLVGRFRAVLTKIQAGDSEGALHMLKRIQMMLQQELGETEKQEEVLTSTEIKEHVNLILSYLDEFKTKEALAKCREMQKLNLPKYIGDLMEKCAEFLNNYDDEEAEKILRALSEQLK